MPLVRRSACPEGTLSATLAARDRRPGAKPHRPRPGRLPRGVGGVAGLSSGQKQEAVMKRKTVVFLSLVAAVCLVAAVGCSTLTTSADYDPSTDFSKYKTWDW